MWYLNMNEAYSPAEAKLIPSLDNIQPLDLSLARRVLVLVPHPDDEVIGCGGLLAQLAIIGVPVCIVLVTDGSGGPDAAMSHSSARQAEFLQSLQSLGLNIDQINTLHTPPVVTNEWQNEAWCWQHPDGQLNGIHQLALQIKATVLSFDASLIVAPWCGEAHSDHAIIGQAVQHYHQQSPLEQGVLFYEIWSPLTATHWLDITDVWPQKAAALSQHQTALKCGDYMHAMQGLAAYRSLLIPGQHQSRYAEAYCAWGWPGQTKQPRYRLALPKDVAQIRDLFFQVFNTELPYQWWSWKYEDEPVAGTVALDPSGKVIAFYGAQSRQGWWGDQPISLCQQADVMVAPEYRFSTRRGGVFQAISQLFLLRHTGTGQYFDLAFGFPTPRALKVGVKLALYQQGGEVSLWQHPCQTPLCFVGLGWRSQVDAASKLTSWDWLSSLQAPHQCKAGHLSLNKTPVYWHKRFACHPTKKYEVIRLYRWGKLKASAIVQLTEEGLEVMDIAINHHQQQLIHRLLEKCRQYGLHQGADYLTAWGTTYALADFPKANMIHAGFMALPGIRLDASLATDVAQSCWMLGGDTDFR